MVKVQRSHKVKEHIPSNTAPTLALYMVLKFCYDWLQSMGDSTKQDKQI